jgi:hypothetical protein
METRSREKAVRLAVINVGVIFIASFALPTHNGLANALDAKLRCRCTSLLGGDHYERCRR